MKQHKLHITQKDGIIEILRNGEVDYIYDCNRLINRIKEEKMDSIGLANHLAEIIYGCLNCKTATCRLTDLNERNQYSDEGTYFEFIDTFED